MPPPAPPACASYPKESVCPPSRCFWLEAGVNHKCTGCCANPPIPCDDINTSDGALCLRLTINTTQIGPATLSKSTADPNTRVLVPAPKKFSKGNDAWFSFKNGVFFANKTERFWQWTAEYTAPCLNCAKPSVYLISMGMGLTPAGWDFTPSIGGDLAFGGFWMNTPLVLSATIHDEANGNMTVTTDSGALMSSIRITKAVH